MYWAKGSTTVCSISQGKFTWHAFNRFLDSSKLASHAGPPELLTPPQKLIFFLHTFEHILNPFLSFQNQSANYGKHVSGWAVPEAALLQLP